MRPNLWTAGWLAILFSVSSCATQRPVLYPDARSQQVSRETIEQDIDDCMRRAEQFVSSSGGGNEAAREVGGTTAAGAATGAAAGAVGGAIHGSAGHGAAVGAASGATAGFMHSVLRRLFRPTGPSLTYKAFVERCLRERGYEPIGWE